MNNRINAMMSWWRERDGLYVDIADVQPFITLHRRPRPQDTSPMPLLVGPWSLQAKIAGSHDPAELHDVYVNNSSTRCEDAIASQRYALETRTPLLTEHHIAVRTKLGDRAGHYQRLIMPVHTAKGAQFLITYSELTRLH